MDVPAASSRPHLDLESESGAVVLVAVGNMLLPVGYLSYLGRLISDTRVGVGRLARMSTSIAIGFDVGIPQTSTGPNRIVNTT